MRLKDYFSPENERKLKELCLKYYELRNESGNKGEQLPILETAQKLGLLPTEYSEFLIWLNDGGYDSLVQSQISDDFAAGAEFLSNPLTDLP